MMVTSEGILMFTTSVIKIDMASLGTSCEMASTLKARLQLLSLFALSLQASGNTPVVQRCSSQ